MNDNLSQPVLVIEPDRALAASLEAVVQVSGFRVVVAPDAEEALKSIYGGTRYHAILVAYDLPQMSGAEFCAIYRGLASESCTLLITMSSDHRNKLEMLASGADAFLTKPFSMAALKATLLEPRSESGIAEQS